MSDFYKLLEEPNRKYVEHLERISRTIELEGENLRKEIDSYVMLNKQLTQQKRDNDITLQKHIDQYKKQTTEYRIAEEQLREQSNKSAIETEKVRKNKLELEKSIKAQKGATETAQKELERAIETRKKSEIENKLLLKDRQKYHDDVAENNRRAKKLDQKERMQDIREEKQVDRDIKFQRRETKLILDEKQLKAEFVKICNKEQK